MKKDKKKQFVAIVLLAVFGGSILLSGIITLYVSFMNKSKSASAQSQPSEEITIPLATDNASVPVVENTGNPPETASTAAPVAEHKETPVPTAAPAAQDGQKSVPAAPQESAQPPKTAALSPLLLPSVNYTVDGANIFVTAKINAPDDTVFTVVVMSTDMSVTKKATGTAKSGEVQFAVEMPDTTSRKMKGSFQLSMTENAQPVAAVSLYGANGEKIQADVKKGGTMTKSKNAQGVDVNKFTYMFDIQYH